MKNYIFCIILFLLSNNSEAQKLIVSDTAYRSWTNIGRGEISNDGKFSFYYIDNKPINSTTFVITSTDKSWSFSSSAYSNTNFSEDSKSLFAIKGVDSLIKMDLKTKKEILIARTNGYELYNIKDCWLIYEPKNFSHVLVIQNLINESKIVLNNVHAHVLNKAGQAIISISESDSILRQSILWTDLATGMSKTIYEGDESTDYIFDSSGKKMAFISSSNNEKSIWYYFTEFKSAKLLVNDRSEGILKDCKIETGINWSFDKNGENIFFTQLPILKEYKTDEPDIWNYKDAYLLSSYKTLKNRESIVRGLNLSLVDTKSCKIRQLLHGMQKVSLNSPLENNSDIIIVESYFGTANERSWNQSAYISYYLLIKKTGQMITIKENSNLPFSCIELSPDGRFLVYYDQIVNSYFSYDINLSKTENLSKHITAGLSNYNVVSRGKINYGAAGIKGWISASSHAIIQGTYDLIDVDLENKKAPVNITKEIGQQNGIIFSITQMYNDKLISPKERILVSGFTVKNKHTSIYELNLSKKIFRKMYETDCFLDRPYDLSAKIQKARNSNAFLLKLEKATESSNYFFTTNFRSIHQLSNNCPEKRYKWIKSEIITYNDSRGNLCEAILYKPEDFKPEKKYPVIFNYYLDETNTLNEYISPIPKANGINIPVLVSHDYIFCIPNIYQEIGKPGESALLSVLAAAEYLSKFNWIDSTKMAISGHSWGGFETNYIITHSHRFSAALSGAGISNFVESYNDLNKEIGSSAQGYIKYGAGKMKRSLNEFVEGYNENSPILYTKDITTPLLLIHNNGDLVSPVDQSLQFFVQLRSEGKPTWLVQYKNEAHGLVIEKDQLDFQAKVMGFFDHYLKNVPIPRWMDSSISQDNF